MVNEVTNRFDFERSKIQLESLYSSLYISRREKMFRSSSKNLLFLSDKNSEKNIILKKLYIINNIYNIILLFIIYIILYYL